ncbi:hypothetical protein Tco_0026953 [Tanacetum coccineum]
MKSITEGPFQMGMFRETIAEGAEGALHLGPERVRVFTDLTAEDKERYKADIRATNILLQGIPKDIYTLINHFTDAKDIWDNVKMILEGSELTKDDCESQLYDEFEHFCQIKGETIHVYYVRFTKLINDMRNIKMTMPRMQLNSKFVNNMLPEWSRFIMKSNLNRGLKRFSQPTNDPLALVCNASNQKYPTQSSESPQSSNQPSLVDNFQLDSGSTSTDNLIEKEDHVFEADQCDAFDSDVDEGPTTQTMFMANLTSEEAGASYDLNIPSEVQDCEYDLDCEDEYHEVHEMQSDVQHNYVVDSDADYTIDSNIIPYDKYVEDNEEHVVKSNVSSVRNDALMSILDEMHKQGVQRVQTALFKEVKVMEEIFDQMNDEVDQNTEAPDFNSFFKIKNLEHQIQEKDNVIRDLKFLVSNMNDRSCEPYNANDVTDLLEQNEWFRAEIEKVKQHYKEMFESIKITRTSTNEKTSSLLTQIEDLKAQLEGNLKVATRSFVKLKVLAPGMYAIDVKPIPHPLKNARSAHLTYINHLKESVEIVREIVEEARVVKPLDNALNYACQYTKLSQELLEYVIGTCPKSFNERDNKAPSTPVTRKKQVTFNDKLGTSFRVNGSTEASGSKPRSNTKKNRIMPAKTENKKKVEDHPSTNKSVWTKVNRVDSSISSKRVVVQVILWYLDSVCSKHMTENRSKLMNFVEKFIGTVRFGNDHFGAIMGYGDYVIGDSVISRVYYVEGLGHNLFSVGQFFDSDLEVANR